MALSFLYAKRWTSRTKAAKQVLGREIDTQSFEIVVCTSVTDVLNVDLDDVTTAFDKPL